MSKGPKIKRIFETQRLFTPKIIRRYTNSSGVLRNQTQASMSGSTSASTSGSFRYDPPGSPLKSTQQLPLDFSKFENHTYFASAESNVNIAFEKIVNKFPFDGTNEEYEDFLDQLSGFENYVLNSFPRYTGYLTFDSNVLGTDDSKHQFIEVKDRAGVLFPALSRIRSAKTILDPQGKSFSIECKLFLGPTAGGNTNQFIFQHMSSGDTGEQEGYAAFIDSTSSTHSARLNFAVISGSQHISASYYIDKGHFYALNFVYDARPSMRRAAIMSGSTTVATSKRFKFNSITTGGSSFFIASGSAVKLGGSTFAPAETFSGSIDEFRVFSGHRKMSSIEYYEQRTMFAQDKLKLLFRFNEPTGSYTNNDVVLDHSGMSLHAKISGWTTDDAIRIIDPDNQPPMLFERSVHHPVLFPSYPTVLSLNNNLLLTASQYDANNPNLITKLIPQHYLDEAASTLEISENPDGTLMDGISASSPSYDIPGGARMGQPQIIASLLFMWAKEFDVIKAMLDHVSNLVFAEYDYDESIADQLLPYLAKHYGLELPNMFRNAKMNQFFSGEEVIDGRLTKSLQFAQNEIWRRILINVREIISSKGTVHAIKALFRTTGIDPDRIFRFVEYGGTETQRLGTAREVATEISSMLDFSGSLSPFSGGTDAQGFFSGHPSVQSTYMSASRVEKGWPFPAGQFVEGVSGSLSNVSTDGLLTSGSWTIETRVKFPMARNIARPQSLFRLHTTASLGTSPEAHRLILNVVAVPPTSRAVYAEKTGESVTLYCRPGFGPTAPLLTLPLTGADIFDGRVWYISCGRERYDSIGSYVSSSYFLRVAKQEYGNIVEYHTTASFFAENRSSDAAGDNIFQLKQTTQAGNAVTNASGSFIVLGPQQIVATPPVIDHLNDEAVVTATEARATRFSGLWGHTRFWSQALDEDETKEHLLNFHSLGVKNPLTNFNFTPDVTGSFQKLRLNLSTDQPNTESNDNGQIILTDFSQNFNTHYNDILQSTPNGLGALGSSFAPETRIIIPERFDFSYLSPNYDEMPEQNKVRVAGFSQGKNLFEIGGYPAPVYEIVKSAEPVDDARFGIEFSIMQALDEDIMNIFATLDSLDLAIGAPELMFAEEYPDLARLRKIYFNRLTGTINYKKLFDFFRWLDDSFDGIIEGLIPRKTNYMGFNFIIEGHGLERPKVAYGSGDVYLGESTRRNLKGIILLRQLVGDMRKY